jgi:hypothetical protein
MQRLIKQVILAIVILAALLALLFWLYAAVVVLRPLFAAAGPRPIGYHGVEESDEATLSPVCLAPPLVQNNVTFMN